MLHASHDAHKPISPSAGVRSTLGKLRTSIDEANAAAGYLQRIVHDLAAFAHQSSASFSPARSSPGAGEGDSR